MIKKIDFIIKDVDESSFPGFLCIYFIYGMLIIIRFGKFYFMRIKKYSEDSKHYGRWYYNGWMLGFILFLTGSLIIFVLYNIYNKWFI